MKKYRLIITLVAFGLSLSATNYRGDKERGLYPYAAIEELMREDEPATTEQETNIMRELPRPEIPSNGSESHDNTEGEESSFVSEQLPADSESDSDDEFLNQGPEDDEGVVLVAPQRPYPHSPTSVRSDDEGSTLLDRVRSIERNLRRATNPRESMRLERRLGELSREARRAGDRRILDRIDSIRAGIRRVNSRITEIERSPFSRTHRNNQGSPR